MKTVSGRPVFGLKELLNPAKSFVRFVLKSHHTRSHSFESKQPSYILKCHQRKKSSPDENLKGKEFF